MFFWGLLHVRPDLCWCHWQCGNKFLCVFFSLQMKRKQKPTVIVIPVTTADKQPSPKQPPPHNEMWSIISRVGTRQIQNPPSDVFFFSHSAFHRVFCFIHFPPPPPRLSLSVCQTLLPWHGLPQLFRDWGINEMLSPQIISHSPEEKNIRMRSLLQPRYDVVVMHCWDRVNRFDLVW